jgi:hypothetical protein
VHHTGFRTEADRYRLEEETGAGGMGTIYRAYDRRAQGWVALKVLHRSEGRALDRFRQEAALLAELAHPAIVRYVDHGVSQNGEPYLVMEWLEGGSLEDHLQKGPVGLLEVARLARRVLEALAVAHRRGIVHRDIKPANLFLPAGDLAQVKVLDFGIARRMLGSRRITLTGATLGTPMYMSPEQARAMPNIDARSDLFSLGCVLFECATGKPPFIAESGVAVLAKICLEELDVRGRCRTAPAPFVALLEKMLVKDPVQRTPCAAALAEELGQVIDDLQRMGFPDPDPSELRRRATGPVVIADEQRVLSAILVCRPVGAAAVDTPAPPAGGTWDLPPAPDQPAVDVFDEAGYEAVQAIIHPFGARVDRFLGGSMLITLAGRGTASDRAAQAARCALRLKALLPWAVLAVSTGRAQEGGELPMGEVIDWAARLLAGERPGAVCLDADTAELLEGRFGVGGAAKRYLLFARGLPEPPRTVLGKELPCVGRDRELGTLEALWEECTRQSAARAVLVTAPAGGGKSRVRRELLERLQSRGLPFTHLVGRAAQAPFGLLAPALRGAAGLSGGEAADIARRRLQAQLGRHLSPEDAARVVPLLTAMAGVGFAEAPPAAGVEEMAAAWRTWLEAECTARPVLLVLDDLQWADPTSLRLVDQSLRGMRARPFMVLAFARPEIDQTLVSGWCEGQVNRIALAPLTSKACQKLARRALGNLGAEKAAFIVDRADGNPLLVEELLRAVAAGADIRGGDRPPTPLEMVQARLEALSPPVQQVLRVAAGLGESFRASALGAALGAEAAQGLPLDAALATLVEREVIFTRPTAAGPEYVFRHALLREAAARARAASLSPEPSTDEGPQTDASG